MPINVNTTTYATYTSSNILEAEENNEVSVPRQKIMQTKLFGCRHA